MVLALKSSEVRDFEGPPINLVFICPSFWVSGIRDDICICTSLNNKVKSPNDVLHTRVTV